MSDVIQRIHDLHREEHRHKRRPVVASDLPISYEAITTEWLTSVLCPEVPQARVESMSLGPVDNGSSNRRKIAVSYNEAGRAAGLPTRLFCKATHEVPNRIGLGIPGAILCEQTFFRHVRPRLDIEAPVAVHGHYDPESFNSILIMKDISDQVESFCDHRTPMSRKRLEGQMALLATMHGQYHESPAFETTLSVLPTFVEFMLRMQQFGFDKSAYQGFVDAESVIPARLLQHARQIWPKTVAATKRQDVLPQTFVHNDVHLKNWYILPGDRMGLSDWQCCTRGHWSRDLAYAISTACSIDDRRLWERELIELYLDRLAQAGGPRVSFDEAWLHYRQQLFSVLAFWTVTLSPPPGLADMQPRDITLEFIGRIAAAMDDNDSITSIESI